MTTQQLAPICASAFYWAGAHFVGQYVAGSSGPCKQKSHGYPWLFGICVVQCLAGAEALRRNDHKIVGFEHVNGLINLVKAEDHNRAFGLALHKGIHVFHVDAVF